MDHYLDRQDVQIICPQMSVLFSHNTDFSTFGVRFALRGFRLLNADNTDGDRGLISDLSSDLIESV